MWSLNGRPTELGKILMIMRDVNSGWLIRYVHANVASFFFIFVYLHIGRNLYYGSYKSPRVLAYSVGVIILA
jgi:ubiquinol-cytochrome c reductase cytochrome b subunit